MARMISRNEAAELLDCITWGQECCEARGATGSVGQVIGTIGLFA